MSAVVEQQHIVIDNLWRAIDRRGFKTRDLAERIGVSLEALQRKLSQHIDFTTSEIANLCEVLNVTAESLFSKPENEAVLREDLTTIKRNLEASPEVQMWAAANLDPLSEHISFSDKKVSVARAEDGKLYRAAFVITVAPGHGRTFNIKLFAGASSRDLANARRVISEAKRGRFAADTWWRVEKFANQSFGGWQMTLHLWNDGKGEPNDLRPCAMRGCVEPFHAWSDDEQDEPCVCIVIEHPDDRYIVRGFRWAGDKAWQAEAGNDCDIIPDGPAGLKMLRDFANDFAWVQGECDRLNAAEVTA
ncbi:helix-turn-helix domain-containing protein [Leucobacter japonicus]|uniref:helix-turn-helix domain-containing protein n=1 Tax=Leucobacter japonicus TaxID=1461259 RepID=UPI0006A76AF3|nr:helix-turn-helix transcriptional regulator [Leucobacter japonicus]